MKLYQVAYELVGKLSSSFNTSMFSASESLQGLNNKLKDINSSQKNITGFAKLEADAQKTSTALAEARKRYAELNNEIKNSATPTKQQSQNLEQARLKVENLSNKLGTQRQRLSEVKNELKSAGVNYKNLSAENERLAQSAMKAQKAQEKLRNVLSKEQALNSKRSEMQSQIVGAAAVAFSLAQPIREAIAFESAMSDVRKTVDFDTPEQFAQMQKDILAMGRTLPLTHEGLAALVAAGGQAGLAREELAKFAEDAAKMATAFDGLSADQAGTMMANWRTAFKMSQDEVRALSDQINYLSNVTASDTTALSEIVTRVGALGDVAGLSASSIVAIGTTMASVGVGSEVAATGIKNFMLSMVAGEAATKSQQEAYAKLGLDSKKISQDMQKDSEATIIKVLEGVSKLNKAEQATTLQQLFGKESIGAIAPLLNNLDELRKNLNAVGDANKYAGSMQKEFEARNATAANTLQLTKNRVAEVGISIGAILLPGLNKALEVINPLIGKVADFANENKTLVGVVGGLVFGLAALKIASLSLGYAWTFVTGGALILKKAYLAVRYSTILATASTKAFVAVQWLLNGALKGAMWLANVAGMIIYKTTMIALRAATIAFTATKWLMNAALAAAGWTLRVAGIIAYQTALLALRGVTAAMTAGQWLMNAAMTANPIGLIIVAIGALIAAGVALYMHWDTVKAKFVEVWESIKAWFSSISLYDSGMKMLQTLADGIKAAAYAPVEAISGALGKVREYLPFSDAKVGPLSQLTLSGQKVIDTLREGMLMASPLTDAANAQFGTALGGVNSMSPLSTSGLSPASSNMNVTYSPVINIQGTANKEDINQAIKDGNDDFLKKLRAAEYNNKRLSYA